MFSLKTASQISIRRRKPPGPSSPLVQDFPHSGFLAKGIFAVGVVGLGMLAVPILAGSASYAMAEACKCRVGLNLTLREGKCFYSVIIAAMLLGSALNLFRVDPIKALIFSSVVNGICSVPLLYLLAKIGRNSAIMGAYRSGWLSNLIVWIAFASMSGGAPFDRLYAAPPAPSFARRKPRSPYPSPLPYGMYMCKRA